MWVEMHKSKPITAILFKQTNKIKHGNKLIPPLQGYYKDPPHLLLLQWESIKAVLLIQDANKEANCLGLITLLVARNAQKLPAEKNTLLIFMVFFSGSWFGTDGKHSIFRVELYIDKELNYQLLWFSPFFLLYTYTYKCSPNFVAIYN